MVASPPWTAEKEKQRRDTNSAQLDVAKLRRATTENGQPVALRLKAKGK
jgi:hypothetical protein